MTDFEKVVKGMEECLDWHKTCQEGNCPYKSLPDEYCCTDELMKDALALICEQREIHKPRVLTLEELRQLDGTEHFVWVENNGDEDCYDGYGEITISYLSSFVEIFQFGNEVEWKPCNNDYGKTWRCWSARPTNEQRKAVKWE